MSVEFLFQPMTQTLPSPEEMEALLRRIFTGCAVTVGYDDPAFSPNDIPSDVGLDDIRSYLVEKRPALGWVVTCNGKIFENTPYEGLTFNGILLRSGKSLVLRAEDDDGLAVQTMHLARSMGPGAYRLGSLGEESKNVYLAVLPPGVEPVDLEKSEANLVFQISANTVPASDLTSRFIAALHQPEEVPEDDDESAGAMHGIWLEGAIKQLKRIPGYKVGNSYGGSFFLQPHDASLSIDEAAARFFAALQLPHKSFKDQQGDYVYAWKDADHAVDLKRAARYDHPDYMFMATIMIRLGEMPETLHWSEEELLSMTVDRIGIPILLAGFRLVADYTDSFFDYASFPAREYYLETSGNGQPVVKEKDIMMVKSKPRP